MKPLAVTLLILGELVGISAEMFAARTLAAHKPFLQVFLMMFGVMIVAGGILVAGYMLGYDVFKNIWIVSVISITSILIIEPTLAYTVFKELPTKGALIGLVFGVLGFAATLFL